MLAKAMGLDRAASTLPPSDLSPEKVEERRKVFRSLYIRDQCSAITRGAPTWLPNRGFSSLPAQELSGTTGSELAPSVVVMQEATQFGSNEAAWVGLAHLQNTLLHILFARENNPPGPAPRRRASLVKLARSLEQWSQKHGVPSSAVPTTVDDFSLHLAFIGTRMRVLASHRGEEMEFASAAARVLHDARLSCLLLLVACDGGKNKDLVARLERLLDIRGSPPAAVAGTAGITVPSMPSTSPSVSPPPDAARPPLTEASGSRSNMVSPAASKISKPSPNSIGAHRLALVFPTIALFALARNILGMGVLGSVGRGSKTTAPNGMIDEQQKECRDREIEGDDALLKSMSAIFPGAATDADSGPDNRAAKVGRVVRVLVEIISSINHHAPQEHVPDNVGDNSAIDPLLDGAWAMLPNGDGAAAAFSTAAVMPDLDPLSPGSSWANDQGSSAEYLSRTASSSASISAATMSEVASDISQFIDRMSCDATSGMWVNRDNPAYQEDVTESNRAKRKRARTRFGLGGGEDGHYL